MRIRSHAPLMYVGMTAAAVITLAFMGIYGELGRPFDVTLLPSRTRVPSGELTCHLRCIRIVKLSSQGSSAGRSDITTLWETTWTTRAGTIHPNIGLPLSLPLPPSGDPSNISPQTSAGTQWQLNVVVPTRGFKDESVFDLPVRA